MVGRGARKAPGKNTVRVVDFADNITRFGDGVVRAADVYPGYAGTSKPRQYTPPPRPSEPPEFPRFVNDDIPGFGRIPIALGQTFGAEIELTSAKGVPKLGPAWREIGLKLLDRLTEGVALPLHPEPDDEGSETAWRAVYDGSAGWEAVSPILVDAAGLDERRQACGAITELVEENDDLRVNRRTGLHATPATRRDADEKVRGFARRVQRIEPGLFTPVAPSRLYRRDPAARGFSRRAGNRYCLPPRGIGDPDRLDLDDFVDDRENRSRAVNLTKSPDDVRLVGVRMHGGTHELEKIALWLSLWMQLFNAARHRWAGPAKPGLVFPGRNARIALADAHGEDIVALLKGEGIPLTPEFVRLLRDRRTQLRPAWERVVPNRVGRWAAAGWYD
jgi:hypothetical protein